MINLHEIFASSSRRNTKYLNQIWQLIKYFLLVAFVQADPFWISENILRILKRESFWQSSVKISSP